MHDDRPPAARQARRDRLTEAAARARPRRPPGYVAPEKVPNLRLTTIEAERYAVGVLVREALSGVRPEQLPGGASGQFEDELTHAGYSAEAAAHAALPLADDPARRPWKLLPWAERPRALLREGGRPARRRWPYASWWRPGTRRAAPSYSSTTGTPCRAYGWDTVRSAHRPIERSCTGRRGGQAALAVNRWGNLEAVLGFPSGPPESVEHDSMGWDTPVPLATAQPVSHVAAVGHRGGPTVALAGPEGVRVMTGDAEDNGWSPIKEAVARPGSVSLRGRDGGCVWRPSSRARRACGSRR
ncbi:hypothetical protein [Streptomyces avermitilis]|uniref:hypothetical protein n=1 Tax=Streptomyces avermitilis TaxID=33903 RepID=UPI0036B026DB